MNVEPRSGKLWAVLQFPLTRIVIAFGAIALLAFPILVAGNAAKLHGLAYQVVHLLSALVALGVYLVFVHFLEWRKPTELALRLLLPQFSKGFAVGAVMSATVVGILWLGRAYQVDGTRAAEVLFSAFIGSLGAAVLEEIAVRGVLFRIMEESLGTWFALALSALIFGLLHAVNPGASWRDVLGIALEGGLLLAAVYVYARQLWICIGLHAAWNFMDGGLFGASGQPHSFLAAKIQGPEWMTGGAAGLDGSLVGLAVCLTTTVVFLLLAQRRGHIMAPSWRRK